MALSNVFRSLPRESNKNIFILVTKRRNVNLKCKPQEFTREQSCVIIIIRKYFLHMFQIFQLVIIFKPPVPCSTRKILLEENIQIPGESGCENWPTQTNIKLTLKTVGGSGKSYLNISTCNFLFASCLTQKFFNCNQQKVIQAWINRKEDPLALNWKAQRMYAWVVEDSQPMT